MSALIIACNYREALEVARLQGFAPARWRHVRGWNDVRGQHRPRVLQACLPDDWYTPAWWDVRQALRVVEAEIERVGCPFLAPHADSRG